MGNARNHETELYDAPVVQLVDEVISQAIARRASDIHVEPAEHELHIRLRIDGVLSSHQRIERAHMQHFIARLKVMAHINIAEKRVPQDGKFSLVLNKHSIDFRVSTFPSLYGETLVIRVLDRSKTMIDLEHLGLTQEMHARVKELLLRSSGFFLSTGPTGSGKTTTLYAGLSLLNDGSRHIITLEDPIEYTLSGVTQGQINPEAGFTFERGIRALLRQDPDIIMIGEIRDKETAGIAMQASLTGHVVLSTAHTNDAPSALMRLIDMGIEPFLINAALTGILAQRLARLVCQACKQEVKATHAEEMWAHQYGITLSTVSRGAGCKECDNTGSKGRIGIFELLVMSHDLKALVMKHLSYDAIYKQACRDGMRSLMSDGLEKVKAGLISPEELMRVVG